MSVIVNYPISPNVTINITPTNEVVVNVLQATPIVVNLCNEQGTTTTDYTALSNKPRINNVELVGNKTSAQLGLEPAKGYNDNYVTDAEKTAVESLVIDYANGKVLSDNNFTDEEKTQGAIATNNATLTTLKQVADYAEKVGYNKIIDLNYTISTSGTVQINLTNDSKGNLLSTYGLRKISLYCYLETNATATGKRLGISVNNVLTSTYKQTTSLAAYMLSRIGASGIYRIDLEIIGGILAYRVVGDQSSSKVNDSTFVNVTMINGINTSISAINSIQLFVLASESTEFNGQIKILGIYE